MKQITSTLVAMLCGTALWAQHPTCDGTRYLSPVFNEVDTVLAVKFGENTTPGGTFQELFMDVYMPANDTAAERPAVLLAFGGSFISGDRAQLAGLCDFYVRRGFVCSCIDYRLYDVLALPDSVVMVDEVVKAVGDFKAAIRFMREDAATANQFQIDPDYIFIGGVSAGAIAAVHTAYLDSTDANVQQYVLDAVANNGGWEGNTSTNTQYSSAVQGVLNYSGALGRAHWLNNGEAPIFSVHDDGDGIVPFSSGYATFDLGFFTIEVIYMEGSEMITAQATAEGVDNEFIVIPNSTGHVSYLGDPNWEDSVLVSSSRFLQEILCSETSNTETIAQNSYEVNAFPNPAAADITLRIQNNPMQWQYDVRLVNAMGRTVYQSLNNSAAEIVVPRQDLPAGLYYLHVQPQGAVQSISKAILFR